MTDTMASTDDRVNRICVYCNKAVDRWLPFRIRESDISPFLSRLDPIGSNVERFTCPHCDSIDRERHLHLYFGRLAITQAVKRSAVLHMSPEYRFKQLIQNAGPNPYFMGDLFPNPNDPGVKKMALQQLPFPDKTFAMVIANHVLEHVDDALAAMREMHRVLKPGGRAICQTPYASRLSRTFEEPGLTSESDRLFFYGQEDHLRLFGSDIDEVFRGSGLKRRFIPHTELLPDIDPEKMGVNEHEPFFDFVRG